MAYRKTEKVLPDLDARREDLDQKIESYALAQEQAYQRVKASGLMTKAAQKRYELGE